MRTRIFLENHLLSSLLVIVLLFTGCGQEPSEKNATEEPRQDKAYAYTPLGPLFKLEPQVEKTIEDWDSFWDLQQEMELFRGKNSGDLSFITEDLLRIHAELMHDSLPEKLQNPAVKSRSLLFGTFALKLKDQIQHRTSAAELDTTRVRLLESYNAFRYQIGDALREKVFEDFLQRDTTFRDTGVAN